MNKKLLYKTTRDFLVFSVLVLLISAPVFYFITERLYVEETDESLLLQKQEFAEDFLPNFKISDVQIWNKYNRNVSILSSNNIGKDSLFDKVYFDKLENENEPYRVLKAPIVIEGKNFTYLGRANMVEKEDMVISTALLFLLVIVILLIGILMINKISSKRIWKSFYDTLEQIRDFEIDKSKTPKFMPTHVEEFSQLNKSVERLIEKNTEIYNNQREFVENAAHELQTPLALFQTKIDTLIQFPDMPKEQSQLLGALNDDVSRLNRLNKNLLLLSKIENEHYLEKQPLILNNYLKKNLEFFSEQAKAKNLTIVIELNGILELESNPALVEILINNLFLNAIRHNIPDGKIIIITGNRSVTFSNSGNKNPLIIDKLFGRFSKADPSSQGNGLGLAIIKKIATQNNWDIAYSFENDLHNFTVTF